MTDGSYVCVFLSKEEAAEGGLAGQRGGVGCGGRRRRWEVVHPCPCKSPH